MRYFRFHKGWITCRYALRPQWFCPKHWNDIENSGAKRMWWNTPLISGQGRQGQEARLVYIVGSRTAVKCGETLSQKRNNVWTVAYVDTYLYTDMCTPCEMSSLSFLIFLTFLCSAVSFLAALASSCALSWQEGHPQVRKALQIRGRAKERESNRGLSPPSNVAPRRVWKGRGSGGVLSPTRPTTLTSVSLPSELWRELLPS